MEFSLTIKSEDGKKYYEFVFSENAPHMWLRNEEGEAMGMNKQQLFDHLDKWFKENF